MADISRVQSATGSSTASQTCVVTLGAAPTNGNTLVIAISDPSTNTVSSIAQTNATWTQACANHLSPGVDIWFTSNTSNAGTTITITKSSALTSTDAVVVEYSGILKQSPKDKSIANVTGNSSSPGTGTTAATTHASELWFGGITQNTAAAQSFSAPTNGFSIVAQLQNSSTLIVTAALENIVSATGNANSSVTSTTSNTWAGALATFFADTGMGGADWSINPVIPKPRSSVGQPRVDFDITSSNNTSNMLDWYQNMVSPRLRPNVRAFTQAYDINSNRVDSVEWYQKPTLRVSPKLIIAKSLSDFTQIIPSAPDTMEAFRQTIIPKPRPRLIAFTQGYDVTSSLVIVTDKVDWYVPSPPRRSYPSTKAYPVLFEQYQQSDKVDWYVPQVPRRAYASIKAPQVTYDLSTGRTPFNIPRSPNAEAPANMNIVGFAKGGWSQPKKSTGSWKKGQGAINQLQGIGVNLRAVDGSRQNIRIHKDTGLPVGKTSSAGTQIQATTWSPQLESFKLVPQTINSTYNATGTYSLLYADATNGAFTIYLPQASEFPGGFTYFIKKLDSSANHVTIAAYSGDNIDGSGTYVLSTQYKYVQLISAAPNFPHTWAIHASN